MPMKCTRPFSLQFKLLSIVLPIALFLPTSSAIAGDSLTIISPHRKSIQNEYVPAFTAWYKEKYKTDVAVDWIDQGGSNDDVKFIKAKFLANPKTSGIDVFWGGGTTTHAELATAKLSNKLNLSDSLKKQLPKSIGGSTLLNSEGPYISTALSSFGIFYNIPMLAIEKTNVPTTWESLANPQFNDKIILTDSRKSGNASVMNHVILES